MMSKDLRRLAQAFTVSHLMIPAHKLTRATNLEDAEPFFSRYDVLPYPARGSINGYFHKSSKALHELRPEVMLGSDTPILDLPGLLSEQSFFFVIRSARIDGYIHYSDLNRPPARTPFYALIETAETAIFSALEGLVDEPDIKAVASDAVFGALRRRHARLKQEDLDLGWLSVLGFRELLLLARRKRMAKLVDEQIKLLAKYRNRIAHSNRPLINRPSDVRDLSKVRALLFELIRSA